MDIINDFKKWLETEENLSKRTIEGHISYVRHFLNFFKEEKNGKQFRQLDRDIVELYTKVQVLQFTPDATINSRIASLKKFNEFLVNRNYQDEIVVTSEFRVKLGNKFESQKVSSYEIEKFMNTIKENGNKRDLAIAALLLETKMPVPEIVKLKVKDYDGDFIRVNKGYEQENYKISKETKAVLNQYLEERKSFYSAHSDILFISQKSSALDDKSVFRLFKKYNKLARLPTPITPKKLSLYNEKVSCIESDMNYDYKIDEDIFLKIEFLTSHFEENLHVNVKVSIWVNQLEHTFYFKIGKPGMVTKIVRKKAVFLPKGWIFTDSLSKKDIKNALVDSFYQGIKGDNFISNLETYSLGFDKLSQKGL